MDQTANDAAADVAAQDVGARLRTALREGTTAPPRASSPYVAQAAAGPGTATGPSAWSARRRSSARCWKAER